MVVNKESSQEPQSGFGKKELELIQKMFEHAPVAIAVLEGENHEIRYVNQNMRELFGNRPFPPGTPLREVWTEIESQRRDGISLFDVMDRIYATGESYIKNEYKVDIDRTNTGNPEQGYFNFIYQALADSYGEVFGLLIAGYDVTDQVEARKAKGEYEQRLEFILKGADIGFWEFDTKNKTTKFISDQGKAQLGVPLEQTFSFGDFLRLVHPDDRAYVKESIRKTMHGSRPYEVEYRVVLQDESLRWLLSRGQLLRDAEGQPTRLIGITVDITRQKETEQKLKKAIKIRDDFLSIASHELQTPVTSIKARTELFERRLRDAGDLTYARKTAKINDRIKHLSRLTDSLLDISRLQEGKLQLERQVFSMNELVEETVEAFDPLSQHTIELQGEAGRSVYGDRNRIEQVLTNLLSNAMKYSSETDRVIVQVDDDEEEVSVSVIDSGIGVPEEERRKVFERFYKGKDRQRQTYPGFGIGLYISEQIVKRHGGSIWAEENPGGGTVFTFTLPVTDKASA